MLSPLTDITEEKHSTLPQENSIPIGKKNTHKILLSVRVYRPDIKCKILEI